MLDQKCRKTFESGDLLTMRVCIEKLIKDGNQDDVDTYKKSPLMYACNFGNFELVKTLLDAGVDANKLSIDGDSAIMYAIRNHNRINGSEIVALLLKHGVDIDEDINKKDEYPLLVAAKLDNQQCFKLLLPHSSWCYNHIDKEGYSAVSYASQNSCKRELDEFLLHAKVKERKQSLRLFLRLITFPFILIGSILAYILMKLGILEQHPAGIFNNINIVSDNNVRFTVEALQQYDAEFEAFAHGMKNHLESTLNKSESVVSQLKDNLNKSEATVSGLQSRSNKSKTSIAQLEAAVTQHEIAKSTYVANNRILEALLGYKKRFEHYNFFDNSHSYEKTNFFETSRKYIKDVMPILGSLDTRFNSIELSKAENVNSTSQPAALQFSQPLKANNNINDLGALSEKLNKLSLKKMQIS